MERLSCIGKHRIDEHSNESTRSFDAHCDPHSRKSANLNRSNGGLQGAWSRRINPENRLIYMLDGDDLYMLSVKDHMEIAEHETSPPKTTKWLVCGIQNALPQI